MESTKVKIADQIACQSKFVQRNYCASKSASWDYLTYRIYRPILKLYNSWLLKSWKEKIPWLTPASIQVLDQVLSENMIGLEYGSGKSTLFIASRIQSLVSVEHHADWYKSVTEWLTSSHISNVDYRLIPGNGEESNDEIEARNRRSFDENNARYKDYYRFIESFPNDHFDLILIDGRARTECSLNAVDKLKSGGIFILDNSERPRYKDVHERLMDWHKVPTTTGLTDTTFWFKP